jgi:hypothetical protein
MGDGMTLDLFLVVLIVLGAAAYLIAPKITRKKSFACGDCTKCGACPVRAK